MTASADFYDGTGPDAVWLGSVHHDANPTGLLETGAGQVLFNATDPLTYVEAVADLLDEWVESCDGLSSHPRDGWPYPSPDSSRADWVIQFHHGRAWITTGHAIRPQR
jgi:hypothetical protein